MCAAERNGKLLSRTRTPSYLLLGSLNPSDKLAYIINNIYIARPNRFNGALGGSRVYKGILLSPVIRQRDGHVDSGSCSPIVIA